MTCKPRQIVGSASAAIQCNAVSGVLSHMREVLEDGFEVAVIRDATAAAMLPEGGGYLSTLITFRYMANAVWSTRDVVEMIKAG